MQFTILGNILAKQSFRFTNMGFKYQDKEIVNWQAQARTQLIQQLPLNFKPFTGAVGFEFIHVMFPITKSTSKKMREKMKTEKIFRSKKPDIDNIIKAILDSCKTILFLDDSQVVGINSLEKFYDETPKIVFSIFEFSKGEYV